jgi:hypothetical protein
VFDRAHPRPHRAGQVGDGCVALHVDELGAFVLCVGHPPQHQGPRRLVLLLYVHLHWGGRGEAEFTDCRGAGLLAFAQTPCQVEHAVGGAGDGDAGQRLPGHEGSNGLVVAQRASGLAEQVHGRVPSAADQ